MIRVVIHGNAVRGLFTYRIEGFYGPHGDEPEGISENPLLEACRALRALGVGLGETVALIDRGRIRKQTTVGQGAATMLPAPKSRRRARQSRLQVRGSGIPGDG